MTRKELTYSSTFGYFYELAVAGIELIARVIAIFTNLSLERSPLVSFFFLAIFSNLSPGRTELMLRFLAILKNLTLKRRIFPDFCSSI